MDRDTDLISLAKELAEMRELLKPTAEELSRYDADDRAMEKFWADADARREMRRIERIARGGTP